MEQDKSSLKNVLVLHYRKSRTAHGRGMNQYAILYRLFLSSGIYTENKLCVFEKEYWRTDDRVLRMCISILDNTYWQIDF